MYLEVVFGENWADVHNEVVLVLASFSVTARLLMVVFFVCGECLQGKKVAKLLIDVS